MNETELTERAATPEILRELFERTGADVPAVLTEPPPTLSALAVGDVEKAHASATALQDASIRLTYPEDWVMFKTRDGAEVCYLQDVGCSRVSPLWGISFAAIDLRRDVSAEVLEDGSYFVEVLVRATSALTGAEAVEMGCRSSEGFYGKAWAASEDKPSERRKVMADIRKAAIANGRGRLVRTIAGMALVPKVRLVACGIDEKRIRGVEMQSGTRGGSGTYATEPQRKLIAGEALSRGKVAGLKHLIDYNALLEKIEAASLTGGRGGKASALIERLKAAEPGGVTVDQFEQALGVALGEAEPGSEG